MSMPRSLADRSSLSRGSVITGRSDAISVGSAVTRHWVNSVSDIYGPDEIEELLEDLNRLEMASFDGVMMFDNNGLPDEEDEDRPDGGATCSSAELCMQSEAVISGCITQRPPDDDVEDFDIDGSQVTEMQHFNMTLRDSRFASSKVKNSKKQPRRQQFDGGGGGGKRHDAIAVQQAETANRVAPASNHDKPRHNRTHRRGSSSWSVRSWDSHAHYQDFHNEDDEDDDNRGGGNDEEDDDGDNGDFSRNIVCYCDMSTFKTPRTILRVLLVVTSIACLSTVLTAGTAKMGLFALPHFPRLRIMMFITVFTVIFTLFVLFLNISHLHTFLPVDYGKMQTVSYLLLTGAYAVASPLVFQAYIEDTPSLPNWTNRHLLIIALLGFTCALESLLCSFNCGRPPMNAKTHYDKMAESSTHFTLHETLTTTNQSRAVTDDSLQQKSGLMSSRPSAHSAPLSQHHQRQQQYLVNENYDKSEKSTTKQQAAGQSKARNGQQSTTKATVELNSSSTIQCHKSTGAIPKQQQKPVSSSSNKKQNHLMPDEIVSLPLDDLNSSKPASSSNNGAQQQPVQ